MSQGHASSAQRDSLPRPLVLVVALLGGLSLACGGGADPVDIPSVSTPYLLQTPEGLFDSEGAFVAALGSERAPVDGLVLDAGLPAFFLLSDDDTVRVAQAVEGGWKLSAVRENARVVRAFGASAFVADGDDLLLLGVDGTPLRDDVEPWRAGVGGYPRDLAPHRGESWWTPAPGALPQPVCSRGTPAFKRTCTWLKGDGAPLVEGTFTSVTGFELGTATAFQKKDGWVQVTPDGSTTKLNLPEGFKVLGQASPKGALIGGLEASFPNNVGRGHLAVKGELIDLKHDIYSGDVWCTDDTGCDYRFSEGLAPVRVRLSREAAFANGYVTESGEWAIAPVGCDHAMMSGPFRDGRAFHCEGDSVWMIDSAGAHISGPYPAWRAAADQETLGRFVDNYPSGLFFSEGLAAVPVTGGWGYVNPGGDLVLPGPFEVARPFRLGLATVVEGGKGKTLTKDGTGVMVGR